jgi:hypothetical protein
VQSEKFVEMGLFGDTVQSVVVAQVANGKATATIEIPIPLWEIIVISLIISSITYSACLCLYKKTGKFIDNKITKKAKLYNLENAV